MSRHQANIELLMLAAERLTPLRDEIVFLGGATTALFITDPAAPDARPTLDVDVIVEVKHHGQLARLEKRLRELGFRQPLDGDTPIICRWQVGDLMVDVMPTDSTILGFSNRWYGDALRSAQLTSLPNGECIQLVTAPYFVGTKLEAFTGRGAGDYLASHDFEDVVAVLDGRPELLDEIRNAPDDLREYIACQLDLHRRNERFQRALPGMLLDDGKGSATRVEIIQRLIDELAGS